MTEEFLFTVPGGEPVSVEPFHYAIIGQTQFSGKTTLIKRLAEWAADQGFKVLIFDTKETEADYAGFGREVPVCLRESTDSFVLIGLLESMFRRRLTPYYATLSRITEGAQGFDDIIERAKQLEDKTRSSWLKDTCRVLYDLLERLKKETAKVETIPQLKLNFDINRMVINDFSLEAQQLIVKNAFEDALRIYKRKLIMVIDEAFKFIPQGYSSPATRAIMKVMTQGAKTGLLGWISTQFLAVTDKDPLKACAIKFLGTQDHITEVKHTLALIPEARGKYSPDDIMRLKLGHWVLVRKRPPDVRIVYALPIGVPAHVGRKVALGKLSPEYVRDRYLKPKIEEVDESVWKERHDKIKRQLEALSQRYAKLEKMYGDLMREKNALEAKLREKDVNLIDEIERLKEDLKSADLLKQQKDEEISRLKKRAEAAEKIKEALRELLPSIPTSTPTPTPAPKDIPSEVAVDIEQPTLVINVLRKPLTLSQDDLLGRIAIVYAEGLLPSDKAFTLRHLNRVMEQRFGRKEAFANFSKVLNKLVAWGFLEKVQAGKRWDYRLKMKPEQARQKGLLKTTEKVEA